jgi:ankyrin repeat protein
MSVESYLLEENQLPTKENIELFEAASAGDLRRVKQLLDAGAKPNFFFRPEEQKNSLHIAAEKGFSDIVEVLILHGAVVNSIAASDQTTALILAAQNRHLDAVERLISSGAHIEAGIVLVILSFFIVVTL